jgi:neopullulanase
MFDYATVPELQRWINGGKFDGGGLSPQQVTLRSFYRDVLQLASTSEVLAKGSTRIVPTGSPLALAWFREWDGQKLLFAANFDRFQGVDFEAEEQKVHLEPLGYRLG